MIKIIICIISFIGIMHAASAYNISGYVMDSSTGMPLSGANVATNTSLNTTTDASGFYNFSELSNGTYLIDASLTGYTTSSTEWVIDGTDIDNANITLEPLLVSTYSISGYVLDSSTLEALYGANVTTNTNLQTNSDLAGLYLFSGLTNGSYTINASLLGYTDNSTSQPVSGLDITNANITLSPIPCTDCHYSISYMNNSGRQDLYVNQTMVNESVHASLNCRDCHTGGHNRNYARKMCEDCHANKQNPQTNKSRHNIVSNPRDNYYNGISAANITSCTTCHDSTLYNNAKNTYGKDKGIDCDYCHAFPDNIRE